MRLTAACVLDDCYYDTYVLSLDGPDVDTDQIDAIFALSHICELSHSTTRH